MNIPRHHQVHFRENCKSFSPFYSLEDLANSFVAEQAGEEATPANTPTLQPWPADAPRIEGAELWRMEIEELPGPYMHMAARWTRQGARLVVCMPTPMLHQEICTDYLEHALAGRSLSNFAGVWEA